MSFSFKNEVVTYLKQNKNIAFTARDIAEYIATKFPDDCQEKIKNSKNGYIKTKDECINQ